jgi:hypothetical protein
MGKDSEWRRGTLSIDLLAGERENIVGDTRSGAENAVLCGIGVTNVSVSLNRHLPPPPSDDESGVIALFDRLTNWAEALREPPPTDDELAAAYAKYDRQLKEAKNEAEQFIAAELHRPKWDWATADRHLDRIERIIGTLVDEAKSSTEKTKGMYLYARFALKVLNRHLRDDVPQYPSRNRAVAQARITRLATRITDLLMVMAVTWPDCTSEPTDEVGDVMLAIRIPARAYLWAMANLFWSALRHPLSETTIDLSTGRVLYRT